jgi:hypothetical protein
VTSNVGVFEYFVSQTLNGCQSPRAKLTVTIHAKPALPTITGSNAFCTGGSTLLSSSAPSGNQWYKDGVLLSGATNQTLSVTQAGTYSVKGEQRQQLLFGLYWFFRYRNYSSRAGHQRYALLV